MEVAVLQAIITGVTTIFESQVSKNKAQVPAALEAIISAALTAYEQETGQPLDVTKIKPFVPIS